VLRSADASQLRQRLMPSAIVFWLCQRTLPVARYLGMDLGPMIRKRFADGELYIQIQESIRGCDVYLIQPSCHGKRSLDGIADYD